MTPPDNRESPFTASDEAFFQAGLAPERELISERPVTLDAEDPTAADPALSTALAARRVRFVRPVRSTLMALSGLAVLGLCGHVWRAKSVELAAGTPVFVHASANPAPAADFAAELLTNREAATDADALLATSSCYVSSSSALPADTEPRAAEEAALFGPPAPPDVVPPERTSHGMAGHAKTKPAARGPAQHGTRQARPFRRSAPVTKAALLHALRSS